MTLIKFPKLDRGVTKLATDIIFISDYIYIKDYHALVYNDAGTVVIDLKTLFEVTRDPEIEVDYHLENRLDILQFLDGKFVSPMFWNELVQAQEMELSESEEFIKITSKGIVKELFYVVPTFDDDAHKQRIVEEVFKNLKDYAVLDTFRVGVSTLPWNMMLILNSMFGALIKNDIIILEHHGDDKMMRFTFKVNRHIFGIINNDYDACRELFLSMSLENLITGKKPEREVPVFEISDDKSQS